MPDERKAAQGCSSSRAGGSGANESSVWWATCVTSSSMHRACETRTRTLCSSAAALLLVFFGSQAALPHVHVSAAHDLEICAGHLAEDAAPDLEHAGSCRLCRSGKRTRSIAGPPPPSVDLPTTAGFAQRLGETTSAPIPVRRASAVPRAPPGVARS